MAKKVRGSGPAKGNQEADGVARNGKDELKF
jgi:hypothetical protein